MKKITLLILAIVCVLASILLVSCGNSSSDPSQTRCKHEFKAPVVLKEPSCAEDGYEFTECRLCNYGTVKVIYSLNGGHKVEKIPAVEADCFNEGLSEGEKCSLCGEILKGQLPTGLVAHAYADGICMICGANANSDGIEFILNYDKTYSVKSIGTCKSENIVIPSEYEGAPVTAILDGAFKNCKNIKSVEVPSSVTKIGNGAFAGCAKLEKLVLPFVGGKLNTDGVASKSTLFGYIFGEEKADGCYGVKQYITKSEGYTVYIPSSLKIVRIENASTLPYGTFYGVKSLTSLEIGGDIPVISNRAFYGCTSLAELYLPESIMEIEGYAFGNCSALKTAPDMSLVEALGEYAFYGCSSLESIELARGIYTIGTYAFYKCAALTSIILPDSVRNIESYAFAACSKLESITLGDNIISIGEGAFTKCTALKTIDIPSSVETLEDSVFSGCTALTSVSLSSGIKGLGDELFYGCSGLQTIVIPASVTEFGKDIFVGCTSLSELQIDENNPAYSFEDGVLYSKDKKTLILYMPAREGAIFEIPANVEKIAPYAFYGNESIKELTVGSSVKEIGEYAFAKSMITAITFNADMDTVPARAFYSCAKLTSITLGSSIEKIGEYAFYGIGITEYEIPAQITEIGKYSFSKCEKLTALTIPSTLKTVTEASFYSCTALESITFGDGVQKIGKSAFSSCTSLKSVKIGVGVTAIDGYAFNGCTSLAEIYIPILVTSIGEGAFYKCPETGEIRCEASEKPSGWSDKWNYSKLGVTWGVID